MIPGYHIIVYIGHTLLPLLLAQGSCLQRGTSLVLPDRFFPFTKKNGKKQSGNARLGWDYHAKLAIEPCHMPRI